MIRSLSLAFLTTLALIVYSDPLNGNESTPEPSESSTENMPQILKVPLPQQVVNPDIVIRDNVIHATYAQEKSAFYTYRKLSEKNWSEPVKVSGRSNVKAYPRYDIGPHLAAGKNANVFITWFEKGGKIKAAFSSGLGKPFKLRDMKGQVKGIAEVSNVASNSDGSIFFVWIDSRANKKGRPSGGPAGAVYISKSADGGKTFSKASKISKQPACACCNPGIAIDGKGNIYVVYRTTDRDGMKTIELLTSRNNGKSFTSRRISKKDEWKYQGCPGAGPLLAVSPKSGEYVIATWYADNSFRINFSNNTASSFTKPAELPLDIKKKSFVRFAVDEEGRALRVYEGGMVVIKNLADDSSTWKRIEVKENLSGTASVDFYKGTFYISVESDSEENEHEDTED